MQINGGYRQVQIRSLAQMSCTPVTHSRYIVAIVQERCCMEGYCCCLVIPGGHKNAEHLSLLEIGTSVLSRFREAWK